MVFYPVDTLDKIREVFKRGCTFKLIINIKKFWILKADGACSVFLECPNIDVLEKSTFEKLETTGYNILDKTYTRKKAPLPVCVEEEKKEEKQKEAERLRVLELAKKASKKSKK